MNINEAKRVIHAAALADDTVIMEGVHGIGKSASVKQFAKENEYGLVELFLSHQEVGDIIGIPKIVQQGDESLTTWTKPVWLQRMIDTAWPIEVPYSSLSFKDEATAHVFTEALDKSYNDNDIINRNEINRAYAAINGLNANVLHLVNGQVDIMCSLSRHSVLFLDELNRAPIDVRQSALQLVLEKQIHEHLLPRVNGKASMIVAAINPSDKYQTDELDDALLDRFLHIEVEADRTAFLDYARSVKLNPVVCDFLTEFDRLFWQPEDGGIGATPRSWEKLAGFVDNFDKIDKDIQFSIIKGKVGSEVGSQFLQFYNNYSKVIKIEDIEKLIAKEAQKVKKVETIGKKVAKLIEKQEAVQKTELAKQFLDKYLKKDTPEALPLIAYLYALDIELLASFFKNLKDSDFDTYLALAKHDEPNGKALFTRITEKVAN